MELANPEQLLFEELSELIEQSRLAIVSQANNGVVLTFWQIGRRVNNTILQNKRAGYGKQSIFLGLLFVVIIRLPIMALNIQQNFNVSGIIPKMILFILTE